jgi:hypothetical protein
MAGMTAEITDLREYDLIDPGMPNESTKVLVYRVIDHVIPLFAWLEKRGLNFRPFL